MSILLRLAIALVIGVVAYMLAHLLLNQPISTLIGFICGAIYFFGYDRTV